jgi:hypothetical protein
MPGALSPARIWLAAALLGLVSVVVRGQSALYDQAYAPIWLDQIELALPPPLSRLALLAAAWLATVLIVVGPPDILGAAAPVLARAVALLVCGALAYLIVDMLAAGYVLSGYLVRFSPMPVFVVDLAIALGAWIVLGAAVEGLRALRGTCRLAGAASAVAAILMGAMLAGYWIQAQRTYMAIFPPDQFTPVLDLLAQPPYRGSTAVVSMYSAPVAWQTQQWAYFDPVIGQAEPAVVDGRPTLKRDLDTYVWLADKRSNPDYLSPRYYVCMIPRSFRAALGRASDRPEYVPTCGRVPIVAHAEAGDLTGPRAHVVARDASGSDAWAILELDWR